MANIQINRLTNANVYLDGGNQLGKIEEMSAPTVKTVKAEHKALGMIGKAEFTSGIDKLEAKIKWNSFYADVLKKVANIYSTVKLQIRGNLESYDASGRSAQVPVVVYLTAQCSDFPLGSYKQHDNVELETNLSVYYYKLEINREVITEVDVLANIYKVNGVDLMADFRNNIGA